MGVIDSLFIALPQIAAALEQLTAALAVARANRNLPIINSIKQIKTTIQNDPQILDVTKAELQIALVDLEDNLIETIELLKKDYYYDPTATITALQNGNFLRNALSNLPQGTVDNLQQLLLIRTDRYLPLITTLITTLITILITTFNQ